MKALFVSVVSGSIFFPALNSCAGDTRQSDQMIYAAYSSVQICITVSVDEDPSVNVSAASPCSACGQPVGEEFWTITGYEGIFCESCREVVLICSSCGMPVRTLTIRDERAFCSECYATLVEDFETIKMIYEDLIESAEQVLGLKLKHVPKLQPISGVMFRTFSDNSLPEGVSGLYIHDSDGRASILILTPLPRIRLAAVLAHEIAHAWQGEQCPQEQSARLREGFAEWISWRLIEGQDRSEIERGLIESRTDHYGQGFRFFRDIESRSGPERVLWYARSARSILVSPTTKR